MILRRSAITKAVHSSSRGPPYARATGDNATIRISLSTGDTWPGASPTDYQTLASDLFPRRCCTPRPWDSPRPEQTGVGIFDRSPDVTETASPRTTVEPEMKESRNRDTVLPWTPNGKVFFLGGRCWKWSLDLMGDGDVS